MRFEKKYNLAFNRSGKSNGKSSLLQPEAYKKKAKIILDNSDVSMWTTNKQMIRCIKNKDMIPLPKPGEIVRIRTQQQINLIAVVLKIIDKCSVIDELTISTYTLNNESLVILINLKNDGKIKKMNLLVASSYSFRDKEYYSKIKRLCIENNISLAFAWIHMKITLARAGNNYFQFEGSMNYSTNNMVEQLLFSNDRELYDYDYAFIEKLKSVNHKALDIVVE